MSRRDPPVSSAPGLGLQVHREEWMGGARGEVRGAVGVAVKGRSVVGI